MTVKRLTVCWIERKLQISFNGRSRPIILDQNVTCDIFILLKGNIIWFGITFILVDGATSFGLYGHIHTNLVI